MSIPGPGHLLVVESMSVLEEVDGAQKNMAFSDFWGGWKPLKTAGSSFSGGKKDAITWEIHPIL